MEPIFMGGALIAMLFAFLSLYRAVKGPTFYDRIVAVNAISTKAIVMILLLAYALNSRFFMDVALVYAMCGFVGTVAIIKGQRAGALGKKVQP